jgi:hypothetical protein
MSIHDLLDTPPTGTPAPRLTSRAPVSVKELIGIATLAALAWGAYDHLNKFAEKTAVEHLSDTMWAQRLETQHNFDAIRAQLDQLIAAQAAQQKADAEKKTQARK